MNKETKNKMKESKKDSAIINKEFIGLEKDKYVLNKFISKIIQVPITAEGITTLKK